MSVHSIHILLLKNGFDDRLPQKWGSFFIPKHFVLLALHLWGFFIYRQTPKTRNLTTDEGEFIFILDEVRKNINKRLDVPISDNDKDVKIDSNESRQNIKANNIYLGAIYYEYLAFGGEIENYLDDGEKTISIRNGVGFCHDIYCSADRKSVV